MYGKMWEKLVTCAEEKIGGIVDAIQTWTFRVS